MFKKIDLEDAVGTQLSHDITEIRPGEFKGRAFELTGTDFSDIVGELGAHRIFQVYFF